MADRLAMFAKYWQPGTVKTRLAADLGREAAAGLYRDFLQTLLLRLRAIPQTKVLVFTPADRRAEFAQLAGPQWQLECQAHGDLGERIRNCFHTAFGQRCRRVVLVGSDSPTLPIRFVTEAFDRLATEPVVLGSTADGGFYLVGAAGSLPPTMFDQVAWSTRQVWEQVLANLQTAEVPVALLPPWYDVDELEDLRRLAAELAETDDEPFPKLLAAVRRAWRTRIAD